MYLWLFLWVCVSGTPVPTDWSCSDGMVSMATRRRDVRPSFERVFINCVWGGIWGENWLDCVLEIVCGFWGNVLEAVLSRCPEYTHTHTHTVTNTCNRLFPPDSERPTSVPSSLNRVHLPQFIFPCQGILIGGNLSGFKLLGTEIKKLMFSTAKSRTCIMKCNWTGNLKIVPCTAWGIKHSN